MADQVVEAAERAGLGDFALAGTSLGAAVAVKVAARRPGRVRGLVTLSGFARPRTSLWLRLETWASLHSPRDDALNAFLTSLSFSKEYLASCTSETARYPAARLLSSAPAPPGRSPSPSASTCAATFPPSARRRWSWRPPGTGSWCRSTRWTSWTASPGRGWPPSG
ncbi:alpha/beta hydrolase [Streptomyces sp. NPDC051105]|uniref:alpha/beta fold hydrolase n=1 Tax=Streptomyces sp. NPDC051105 TaxID=3154843 RepID=UPI00341EF756